MRVFCSTRCCDVMRRFPATMAHSSSGNRHDSTPKVNDRPPQAFNSRSNVSVRGWARPDSIRAIAGWGTPDDSASRLWV